MSMATCGCPILGGIVFHGPPCVSFYPNQSSARRPHACPVCAGHGTVSRPPWVAGDQAEWVSSGTATYPCRACQVKGIVWEGGAK